MALGNLSQPYDGTPKSVSVTTTPVGLTVVVAYGGSATPPTYPGFYDVTAAVNDPNYTGSATGTLTISITVLVRHAPTLNGDIDGSVQVLLPESITLNGNAMISGDLLVPGTPVALPVVSAPPPPAGTRNVVLNTSSQDPGDFSTLRNLTLNGYAGQVAVPPGTYGNFIAIGNNGFTLVYRYDHGQQRHPRGGFRRRVSRSIRRAPEQQRDVFVARHEHDRRLKPATSVNTIAASKR